MALVDGDRCISWLPWYHDMGLVGCFLSVIGNQISVDYLRTEDFARRPLAWLDLISRNPGTSVSYSPTFGYDICARRISSQTNVAERFDLSRWRIAGNGADMIRPDVMQGFVDAFADAGFKARAFMPSYGLAEATLAVTLMPPGEGIRVELVEEERLSGSPRDLSRPARYRAIVNCGKPVRDMAVEIRGAEGALAADHQIGKVWCKGPSIMHSYFRDPENTAACLVDGWLDTGDMGYLVDGYLFIVGRAKDMIIVNGRRTIGRRISNGRSNNCPAFTRATSPPLRSRPRQERKPPQCWSTAACPIRPNGKGCMRPFVTRSARLPA